MDASLSAAEAKKTHVAKPQPAAGAVELPGRILAVDYGRRRIGLAISDELQLTARPLKILERKNRSDVIRKIRDVARECGARTIVVGHPLNLDGTRGEMADEAARFATRLRKELGIEVELADERLTSWEAEQTAGETRSRARRKNSAKRATHDDLAAAILLRDYLERTKFNRAASRPVTD